MGERRMTMSFETIDLERGDDGVSVLTLNRPGPLNTVNHQLITELGHALDAVDEDESCRVLILTGAGRAFCAGLDLTGYGDDDQVRTEGGPRRTFTRQREIARIIERLLALRQPVIAAVNGPAAGMGLALVLASDIRIASTSAVFAVGFIRAGFSACDMGTSWLLPRIVGAGHAHELMLTGRRFDTTEAERIGLLAAVVAPADVLPTARAKAAEIRLNPPLSVELTKQGMWLALQQPSFAAAIEFENRQQVITALTDDRAEASQAFLEKRAPIYRYR
jgi:enoyl-CoA hydratase/carnithine racemase